MLQNVVLHTRSQKHDAHARRLARIPFVVVLAVLLLAQSLQKYGHQILQSTARVIATRAGGRTTLLHRLLELDLQVGLLLANATPELDALQADVVVTGFHRGNAYREQRLAHVWLHELVVEVHDLDQILQRAHLDLRVLGLSGLAYDLHDVVALGVLAEVVARELERVEQGVAGGQSDMIAALLFAHAVHDRGQNLITLALQDFRILKTAKILA